MGMYDNIVCEITPPGAPPSLKEWQTKDLNCSCDTYTIFTDGVLAKTQDVWETVTSPKLVAQTLTLTFYDCDDVNKMWYEYEAEIFRGVCLRIRRIRGFGNTPEDEITNTEWVPWPGEGKR